MPVPAGGSSPIIPGTTAPCAWTIDTGCCTDYWSALSVPLQQRATAYATLVLWAATGRQFGECEVTVRPCGRECGESCSGWYWSDGTWVPYIWNGVWRNCWCGDGGPNCWRCRPECQVYLPGPVNRIMEVSLNGVVVDPATYRVDDGKWLVRTHGTSDIDCWPLGQNYNLDTGDDTFIVTYTRGADVPAALAAAAGTLACEYARACNGEECRLPARVSTLTRNGLTISMVDVDNLLDRGLTGLTDVDAVIVALNPYRLKGRNRVKSLDVEPVRMTTWSAS